MELHKKKENSWELYRLSKKFLTENNEKWNKRKEKEQEEINRLERLEQARNKGIKTRLKLLEKEQEKRIAKIPSQIMEQVEIEQKKQELQELKRAKESLWRLRKTEKKLEQSKENIEITKMENKNKAIEKSLDKIKNALMEQEKELRTNKNNTKNKNNKKEKLEQLGDIWATHRWITEFIAENNKKWDQELTQYKINEAKQLEAWDNMTRKEKK